MIFLLLPLALVLPALCGTALLRLIEGRYPMLFAFERWVMGTVLGLTLLLFVQFLLHITVQLPFSLVAFLGVQATATLIIGGLWLLKRKTLPSSPTLPASPALPRIAKILLGILMIWCIVKIALTSVTFLLLTPTFLQDSLSNWNIRGKVFFHTQELTLVMPGEDPNASRGHVSSYPPTVPLAKVLLADYAGEWHDRLINSIHIVWYLATAVLLYYALRRYLHTGWSLLGTYAYLSLPLPLMHGTNAYGDAFVAMHVFIAVSLLFHASVRDDRPTAIRGFVLAALAGALLAFTKNEGLLIFLPPFAVCFALALWRQTRQRVMASNDALKLLIAGALIIAAVAGPWLLFKWANGLTFGNAKPITDLGFGWQQNVVFSIVVNTFSEGNWLLLFPLFFTLLLWRWRTALGELLVPAAFFLMTYFGQVLLYLFTGLSREALMQTGYARGIIHLAPVIVLLTGFLLASAREPILEGVGTLADKLGLRRR